MPYYIQQTEGKQVEFSKKFFEALSAGNLQEAKAIYREATGESGPENNSSWWIYCAEQRIKTHSTVTVAEIKAAGGDIFKDKQWSYINARLAERKDGGKWEVVYEF